MHFKFKAAAYETRVDGIGVLTNATASSVYVLPDMVSIIGSCYGMWRGGVRIRNVVNSAYSDAAFTTNTHTPSIFLSFSRGETSATNSNDPDPFYTSTSVTAYRPENSHVHIQDLRNNPVISTEVPQYSRFYARAVADCLYDNATTNICRMNDSTNSSVTQVSLVGVPPYTSTTTIDFDGRNTHNFFRSLADDGSFSVFISVPPMKAVTPTGHVLGYW